MLIGLSGCGKSTVGAPLSRRLKMLFVDMDSYIVRKEGKSVREIFAQNGEAYFRARETEAAKNLSECGGKVIATGGGVVLNPRNIEYLKQNGIVVFLDRTPDEILKKINLEIRPLLAEKKEKLYEMDAARRPLYEQSANLTVRGSASVAETAEKLEKALKPFLEQN